MRNHVWQSEAVYPLRVYMPQVPFGTRPSARSSYQSLFEHIKQESGFPPDARLRPLESG